MAFYASVPQSFRFIIVEPQLFQFHTMSPFPSLQARKRPSLSPSIQETRFKTRRLKNLLSLLLILHAIQILLQPATACEIPNASNLNHEPPFWCSISAKVDVTNACIIQVEETIVLPWSTGNFHRRVPHQESQNITKVSAVQLVGRNQTDLHAALIESQITTGVISIRTLTSKTAITVVLRYSVTNGVHLYRACGLIAFPNKKPPNDMSIMLVKWAMGAASVENIKRIEVHFSLIRDSRNVYLDSRIRHPKRFSTTTMVNTKDPKRTVIVSHSGNSDGMRPGLFLFYFRFVLDAGWATCPNVRSCLAETRMLEEGEKKTVKPGLIIGLCVGLGCVLVLAGVAVWIVWGKKQRRKAGDGEQDVDANLPKSLQHFAYDTGDEKSSQKWKQWTESGPNSLKEEISAIELT